MYVRSQHEFVGQVSRPKLAGPGLHKGVLLPDGNVAHMQPGGAQVVTLDEFSQGRPVTFETAAPEPLYQQIQRRAYASIGRTLPYDWVNRNCEHYSSWVLTGKAESAQVTAAVILSLIGAFVLAN